MPAPTRHLPVLDFSLLSSTDLADVSRFVAELRHAALRVGFFYVENHGVDERVQREMVEQARRFFRLSLKEKGEIAMEGSPHFRGYTRIGETARLRPRAPTAHTRAGFPSAPQHPGPEPVAARVERAQIPGRDARVHGGAVWRCEKADARRHQVGGVRGTVRRVRLGPADFVEYRYPPMGDEVDRPVDHGLGVGPHKDYGFLTVLMQDDVGGLQVQTADGEWIVCIPKIPSNSFNLRHQRRSSNTSYSTFPQDATPIPNTFVINIGEAFERLTQRCYVATTHRVLNNAAGRDRISVPVFFNPAVDARMPDVRVPDDILALAPARVISDVKEHQLLQDSIYGVNAFKGLSRSHVNVFERWYVVSEEGTVRRKEG
ncbi:hypothetical protein BC938DRAFT_478050 [Jimgerdemannia flammicorona]|uniref:Fe2OG dioxygenase domain-containing protein n=1 Tax=Jimgerdemannia flammicorona TaxID=994334 RepID=A0A433QNJ1_9FUNG|nr:hypothetical protein BC938DRAFT_478050 [Jimgerdemannia flammicorona]